MANKVGANMNFGCNFSASAFGTLYPQSIDYKKASDQVETRDGSGNMASKVFYNIHEEATFVYRSYDGGSTLDAAVVCPAIGDLVTITTTKPTSASGSYWIVEDVAVKGSNTSVVEVSVDVKRYPNITS